MTRQESEPHLSEKPASRRRASGLEDLGPTGHIDTFTRDRLPPAEQWPDLLLDRTEFQYPDYLNVAVELTDRIVERGMGDRVALIGNGRRRTYKELSDWSNRIARALVEDSGVAPGARVLTAKGQGRVLAQEILARKVLVEFEDGRRLPVAAGEILTRLG